MSDAKIRVLIVEDHEKVREQIQRIAETMPGITVVGTATNGLNGVSLAKRLSPDVIHDGHQHAHHGWHQGHP